jgi:hypothetical protein
MNPLAIGSIFELGGKIIDRLFPDPQKKAEAELELLKLTQSGDLQQVLAQLEINAKEAANPSVWVSGWRPYFGWVGGTAFLYVGLLKPLLTWLATIKGWPVPPDIDTEFLWVVVSGLLGIGGLRTYEKKNGVTK